MSTTESLCLSLDNANAEVQRLEAENCKLLEAHPEQAAEADLSSEVQRLRELYGQALRDVQGKDKQAEESRRHLEETSQKLRHQEKLTQEAESRCESLEKSLDAVRAQVTVVRDAG